VNITSDIAKYCTFTFVETDGRSKHAVLEITLSGFEMKTCRNDMVTACSATVSSLHTLLYRYGKLITLNMFVLLYRYLLYRYG
jgi:hypothetical protein